ncbi:MAG: HepT-like ribonuclease domain-containing protein [Bacteroidia bacterium]|nr:HepT-like ribonuclease domain-containing protein [Bacteroidia bacterium]
MSRNPKKYLYDISASIEIILNDYLAGIDSFEVYNENRMVRDAIERRLLIIAEAAHKLHQMGVVLALSDPIINRRNTIAHQYDEINPRKIWQSLHRELPALKKKRIAYLRNDFKFFLN